MTEWERLTVAVTPAQKRFLDNQDESNSEMFRRFVKGWMEAGQPPDGREIRKEQLEKEIAELDEDISEKKKRKQERMELLERLEQTDKLHPDDEERVEDYLSKVHNMLSLNPDYPESVIKGNFNTGTLSTKQLIKEATKRAEEIGGFDWVVWNFRLSERDEPDPEHLPLRMFENGYTESIDPDFAVELVKIRNEALPDDWDGPDGECPRELPQSIRSNVRGTA